MHQLSLIKLTVLIFDCSYILNLYRVTAWTGLEPICTQQDSSKPLSQLHNLTVLYVLNSWGNWHQRFERGLSWDMITCCDLSWQKLNTIKWVWFKITIIKNQENLVQFFPIFENMWLLIGTSLTRNYYLMLYIYLLFHYLFIYYILLSI